MTNSDELDSDRHDWQQAMIPNGHDSVLGWRCSRCEYEYFGDILTTPDPEYGAKMTYQVAGRLMHRTFSCGELVAAKVLEI